MDHGRGCSNVWETEVACLGGWGRGAQDYRKTEREDTACDETGGPVRVHGNELRVEGGARGGGGRNNKDG